MVNIDEATAAAFAVTINKQSYRLVPLTLDDYGELDRWMKSVALEQLSAPEIQALPLEERLPLQAHVADRAARVSSLVSSAHDPDAAQLSRQIASSPAGLAMHFLLAIRHNHSEVTLVEVEAWLAQPDTADTLMSAIERLNTDGSRQGRQLDHLRG